MAHKDRTPGIKVSIAEDTFNKLVHILNLFTQVEDKDIAYVAGNLKKKVLAYSVAIVDGENRYADLKFFPSEASNLIYLLLIIADNKYIGEKYFETLINDNK